MKTTWRGLAERGHLHAHVPLGPLTTYKLGGPARLLVEAQDLNDLESVTAGLAETQLPFLVLGRGSNVLIADSGFDGVVIHLGVGFAWVRHEDDVATAGAATSLPQLARSSARAGQGGLEFFVGIPGSVGGAVRMNAGCHGSETAEVIESVRVFDLHVGSVSRREPAQMDFAYRHSNLQDHEIAIEAAFRVDRVAPEIAEARMREVSRWRKANQPGGTLNAGSVFKNPVGDAAGRIIDSLGLKGHRVGRVSVSQRHANFVVAERGATASEVHSLVTEVRSMVLQRTGVDLVPEIRFVGDFEGEGQTESARND